MLVSESLYPGLGYSISFPCGFSPFFGFTVLRYRLPRPEIDALGPEIGRTGLLRGAAEYVGFPGDLKINETGAFYQILQLCFQQSAGYSTSPEVYHPLCRLRYWDLNQNVSQLQSTTRLQSAVHFS